MDLGNLALSLPVATDVPGCLEWARRAEDMGFESVWVAETGGPDPFVLAGLVAASTRRMRIGTAVSPVFFRTPATIAAAAGTIAQLAPGRFILGLGASSHAMVEKWHGLPFVKPVSRVRETVAIVRAMLGGEKVAFEGKTLRTRGFRLLVPPPQPVPVYIGALRPPMLRLAGEVADGVIVNLFPAGALPRMLAEVRDAASASGRRTSLECVCRHQVLVTNDKRGARELFRAGLTGYFATPVYNRFLAWYGFEEEAAVIEKGFRTGDRDLTRRGMSDRVVDSLGIFGTAEECRERVAEYASAGVTTAIISPLALDPADVKRTIEAFASGS